MKSKVYLLPDAKKDMLDIFHYIAENDSVQSAEYVIDNIEKQYKKLDELPNRGHLPAELEKYGIFDYHEVRFKPYRIIYQVIKTEIHVHCVLDSRRDLQELLERRLLR